MDDIEALERIAGEPVLEALLRHLNSQPPLPTRGASRFRSFGGASRDSSLRWYAWKAWEAGMTQLFREWLRRSTQAMQSSDGILRSAIESCPHIADEEAAEEALADCQRRGGDLEYLFIQASAEDSGSLTVLTAARAFVNLLEYASENLRLDVPDWIGSLKKYLE